MSTTSRSISLLAAFAGIALPIGTVNSAVVFSDDFESPAVDPTYTLAQTSRQVDGTKWVRATSGYGANENGIVDEGENGGANFTDPTGSQAYGTRYTNSGLTSADAAIGNLIAGMTYIISFDVVVDGYNGGSAYEVGLLTFAGGAARNDMSSGMAEHASAVLASISGDASGASYEPISFNYTADGTEGTLGQDLAVRIVGATSSANIDNLSVDVVPEPASIGLLGLGGLALMLRRRR